MSNILKKVTEFVGAASGDCECFCFDKRTVEQKQADQSLNLRERCEKDDEARIYPNDLLPEEIAYSNEEKTFGRWRITIEFWPEE